MNKEFVDNERDKRHYGKVIESKDGYSILECEECDFKHIVPIPTEEELDKFYAKQFYSKEKPQYFKRTKEDLEWWNETYKNYYRIFENYITKDNKRLLEIGSGPGYFLKYGRDLGWDVLGIEPSVQACEYARKLDVNVIKKPFKKGGIDKYGKFDVVFMFNVLEHVPDPLIMIDDAKSLLNGDGLICIVSPNDYNPFQKILRKNLGYQPWWLVPKHHINYFDFKSITKLLEKTGFEIVELMSTFPMEFFLLSGDNYVGNDELGRKCHLKRKNFEMNLYKYGSNLVNNFYTALAKNGIGREFVAIGRKK